MTFLLIFSTVNLKSQANARLLSLILKNFEPATFSGREVARPINGALLEEGSHTMELKTTDLPTGYYTLRLTTKRSAMTARMIKIKP